MGCKAEIRLRSRVYAFVFLADEMSTSRTTLMTLLNEIEYPRRPSNGTLHDFQEIRVIAICAVLSDAENVDDFAAWDRVKEDGLRRFLLLKNGIPSQDTFLRVFGALNPKQFEAVFRRWVGGIVPALSRTLAVDGKTLRGSGKGGLARASGQRFCH